MVDIFTAVVGRILALGYTVQDTDRATLAYNIGRAEAWLMGNLNQTAVPNEIFYQWVDMAAGLFLGELKATGQLPIQFDTPARSVAEGDTTVAFVVGGTDGAKTPEAQFDALLSRLIHPDESILVMHRRMAW